MAQISKVAGMHAQTARPQKAIMQQAQLRANVIKQMQSKVSMGQYMNFNPLAAYRGFSTLTQRTRLRGPSESKQTSKEEDVEESKGVRSIKAIEEISEDHQRKNPELEKEALKKLLSKVNKEDSPDDIIRKTLNEFPDYYLADEALDFLIESADQEMLDAINAAKEELNTNEEHGRYIRAGKNIAEQPRLYSGPGTGTPSELRKLYYDVISNPRPAPELFEDLAQNFDFKTLEHLIRYFLHSIGKDLKSKGPSIERGELHVLFNECRSLQAIRNVYLFFLSGMRPLALQFQQLGQEMPEFLTFTLLAKTFVRFIQTKYPAMEKVFTLAQELGLQEDLDIQSILFNWYRIATYETSPRLFRNLRHREDLRQALRKAIEEIERMLEEMEEENG